MSIEEYSLHVANGEEMTDGRQTPPEIAAILASYGTTVLEMIDQLDPDQLLTDGSSFTQKEFRILALDDRAMAYLGLYYSEKILGAVDLRIFNETKEEAWRESSVAHLEKAAEYFEQYAAIINANYVPQHLARVGSFDVMEILEEVRKDVGIAQKWRPKKIQPSWNAPSNTEYFRKNQTEEEKGNP